LYQEISVLEGEKADIQAQAQATANELLGEISVLES
jgi:hypothetical protein